MNNENQEKTPKKSEKADSAATKALTYKPRRRTAQKKTPVEIGDKSRIKIIPLGGLNEIGKNLTVVQCGDDMVIIDCGLAFPDSDAPGVDIIIPDFTYIRRNADKIRAILITHGHEDHIGAIPYLLKDVNVPVYGTSLTLGLLSLKLKEQNIQSSTKTVLVRAGDVKSFGAIKAEFINVNHSIPDAIGIALHTPAGIVVHTGDFKVDYTPINSNVIDLPRFAQLGNEGVLVLMMDSTNAERAGYTPSESTVGDSFNKLFASADNKRIIVATFASNVHRIQQIINAAAATKRKVAVFGRSMLNVIEVANTLGYLKYSGDLIINPEDIKKYKNQELVLITTGSQGEPLSALRRMAASDHRQVSITEHDFVIISANPIPGNEKHVTRVVNDLLRSGAEVIYENIYDVHVSGHACQEELKLMLTLIKPKYFVPVHGEYKHLMKSQNLAKLMGIPKKNILIPTLGDVIEATNTDIKVTGHVISGSQCISGNRSENIGSVVLQDRNRLKEDGIIVAVLKLPTPKKKPELQIVSKGFAIIRDNDELFVSAKEYILQKFGDVKPNEHHEHYDIPALKKKITELLGDFIHQKTHRRPSILTIIVE